MVHDDLLLARARTRELERRFRQPSARPERVREVRERHWWAAAIRCRIRRLRARSRTRTVLRAP